VYDPVTGQTSSAVHPVKDILFVKGAWIFDTAHEGWNEIHPIKKCQLVATAVYSSQDIVDWDRAIAPYMVGRNLWGWALDPDHPDVNEPLNLKIDQRGQPAEWKKWVQSWCDHVGTITTPSTVDAQSRPENQWTIHPAIDGCQPEGRDAVIR